MWQNTREQERAQDSEIHWVPVSGGGRLWAEHRGEGSPVVLLHGAGMDARLWDLVLPALARHHRVVRFDARGLGSSTPPEDPFDDVEDLRAVLDHFALGQAALVGLSMGGETALDFTLAHPERVSSLVLVAASVSGHVWRHDPELAAYAAARREGDAAGLAELERSIWASVGTGAAAPGGDLIKSMIEDNAQRRLVSERHVIDAGRNAIGELGQITVPTLVVDGECDHAEIGLLADTLVAGIPDAVGERIRGADHYLPLRVPERFTELLLVPLAGQA
ncbi:alpha/beta fold hydrolase [Streptomyces sp. NPDC054842]